MNASMRPKCCQSADSWKWPKYSLRALLLVVAVIPPLVYWGYRYREAKLAEDHFAHILQMVRAEQAEYEELFAASNELCQAQLAVPFANRAKACEEHCDRLAHERTRLAILISTDYDDNLWPVINAHYSAAVQQLREVAGHDYAKTAVLRHQVELPESLKEAGWGYDVSAILADSPKVNGRNDGERALDRVDGQAAPRQLPIPR